MSIYSKPTKLLMREFATEKLTKGQVFDRSAAVNGSQSDIQKFRRLLCRCMSKQWRSTRSFANPIATYDRDQIMTSSIKFVLADFGCGSPAMAREFLPKFDVEDLINLPHHHIYHLSQAHDRRHAIAPFSAHTILNGALIR